MITEQQPPSRPRNEALDGLRGIAALVVVFFHGFLAFDFALLNGGLGFSHFAGDVWISGAPFLLPMLGNFAVALFFILSGYVLSQSFVAKDYGIVALVIKRYVRLVIPIFFSCGLAFVLMKADLMHNKDLAALSKSDWLANHYQFAPAWKSFLKESFYQSLFDRVSFTLSYNESLWTMAVEFYGSALLILVIVCFKRLYKGRSFHHVLGVLLLLLGVFLYNSYLCLFLFGAAINLLNVPSRLSPTGASVLFIVGLFFGSVPYSGAAWALFTPFMTLSLPTLSNGLYRAIPTAKFIFDAQGFYHALGAVLLVTAVLASAKLQSALTTKPALFLGHISFPLYIVHIPLLCSVVSLAATTIDTTGVSYAWVVTAGLTLHVFLSVAVASGLYFICEKPSIAWSSIACRCTDGMMRALTRKMLPLWASRLSPESKLLD